MLRDARPFHFGKDPEEAKRAGRELISPFAAEDESATARGSEVYRIHCVPCHDVAGEGQGLAVLRGMLPPPPFKGASAMEMPDGQMFHVLTLGRGNMPSMQARIDDADRWRVIRHIRTLQAAQPEVRTAPDDGEKKEEVR